MDAPPADWLERVAESLCAHEDRRDTLLSFPPRYEVLEEISRGGMGIVYRAWDPHLGRNVALKVLRSEDGSAAAEAHERFQREARLAASLHHPNIVPIYDTGTWNGQDYIAMQLLEGQSLAHAKLDRRTALTCIRDSARALHFAHEQGIVHRDIKPSNLLLDASGRVFIADFGIARQSVATAGMTTPGTIMGTPSYMSPEQASGLPTDARSDVYSLGATLYELLTGRAPYIGEAVDVVDAVRTKDPDSARRLVTDLSKNIEAILAGAMERRPQDRYPSAAALADDIDRYLAGERPLRRPRGLSYKVQREFVRHPWRSAASIVFCLLLLGAGVVCGYVLRAYVHWGKAAQTSDPTLKKSHLKIAARVFALAEEELTGILLQEARDSVPSKGPRKPEHEPQLMPQPEPAKLQPIDNDPKVEDYNKPVSLITRLINSGKLEDARRQIEELRAKVPDRVVDLEIQLRKAEFDSGIQQLGELGPKSEDPNFDRLYRTLQDERYRDRTDRNSLLAPVAFKRGQVLGEQRRWSNAVTWFNEAESLGFRKSELFELRGLALLELEQWDQAQKDLDQLIEYSKGRQVYPPAFARLPYRREHRALQEKKWTEAIQQAEIVFHFDPKHAAAYHDRGLARYGSTRQAAEVLEQDLKTALELDRTLIPEPQYREIFVDYARGQGERFWKSDVAKEREAVWQKTLAWLNAALEKYFPGDPDLLLERAVMKRREGDLIGALADAREALKGRPDSKAHLMVGTLVFLQGRLPKPNDDKTREAVLSLTEAARLAPEDYRPLYWRGLCRRDLGGAELEGALEDLKWALKLHPQSPFLALQLAGTRLDLMVRDANPKEWKEAADEASRAVLNSDSLSDEDLVTGFYELRRLSKAQAVKSHIKESHLTRAQVFNQGGDYDGSIQECTVAVTLDPEFRLAYLWRGSALCSLRNHKEAQEDFRTALKLSKGDERKSAENWLNRCLKHRN